MLHVAQAADRQNMLANLAVAWFAKLFCNFCSCCNKKMKKTLQLYCQIFQHSQRGQLPQASGMASLHNSLAAASCWWPLSAAPQLIWQLEVALSAAASLSTSLFLSLCLSVCLSHSCCLVFLTNCGNFICCTAWIEAQSNLLPQRQQISHGLRLMCAATKATIMSASLPPSLSPTLSPSQFLTLTVSLSLSLFLLIISCLSKDFRAHFASPFSLQSLLFWDSCAAFTYQFQPYICDEQLIFFILKWNRN